MVRVEGTGSMSTNQVIVKQETEFFIRKFEDLRDFMGGAETVKEVEERHTRFECGDLRDGGKIMRLLHRFRGQQCPSGLADSHHILMIAVNGKGMRSNGARRNMKDRTGEFARDLVHVGNHQEQTLRGSECGCECAGLKCA